MDKQLIEGIETSIETTTNTFKERISKLEQKINVLEDIVGVTYDEIEASRAELSDKHKVDQINLKFEGVMGTPKGKKLLHYNILDTNHSKYRSTVTCYAK